MASSSWNSRQDTRRAASLACRASLYLIETSIRLGVCRAGKRVWRAHGRLGQGEPPGDYTLYRPGRDAQYPEKLSSLIASFL